MEASCSGQAHPAVACRPWWEKPRLQLCADRGSTQLGCSYHTLVETQCREVKGADGLPARKCIRTLRKFRDCGRGRELYEDCTEEVTDTHLERPPDLQDHEEPFRAGTAPRRPQQAMDSRFGEAVEDVIQCAQDLVQHHKPAMEPVAEARPSLQGHVPSLQTARRPAFWFMPKFWRSAFTASAEPSRELSPGRSRNWEEYAKDFHEV